MGKKLKRMMAALGAVAILGGCGVGGWLIYSDSNPEEVTGGQQDNVRGQRGEKANGMTNMENMVTASGTTSIGIDSVSFEIDFLEETQLVVEEVYLQSGDVVEAGTKYLKLTQESVDEARAELEEAVLNADISYRSGAITTKSNIIQAKYSYEETMLTVNYAQQVYEETLSSLVVDLEKAQSTHDEAVAELEALNNAIVNDTFYEDYDIAQLKEAYELALDLYEAKLESWGIDESEVSGGGSSFAGNGALAASSSVSSSQETDSTGIRTNANSNSERQQQIKTLKLLKEEAEENEAAYKQALEEYEEALEEAEMNLRLLQNEVKSAKESLVEAQVKYEKQSLSAQTTYETAKVKGQTAQDEYDTELTSLQESLDKLLDAKEEAEENLALFEEMVGDSYLYTQESGTVLRVMVQEETVLSGGSMIMAFSNQDEVTISVSVPQESIASITVGEEVTVIISDAENSYYAGEVTMINPIASSDSRTSVNYTVEVALRGDLSGLSANLTATVLFGVDSDSMQQMMQERQNTGGQGMPDMSGMENMPSFEEGSDMGEMSDMSNMPSMGEKPDMSNMPSNGERPDFEGRNGQGGTVNE